MQLLARITIRGNSPRKSNNRQIGRSYADDRPILRKSDEAIAYAEAVQRFVPQDLATGHEGVILVVATMYYRSRRSDLSLELVQDALQTEYAKRGGKRIVINGQPLVVWPGIYRDDRQIWVTLARKAIDPDNPRAEISIYAAPTSKAGDLAGRWAEIAHDEWADALVSALDVPALGTVFEALSY